MRSQLLASLTSKLVAGVAATTLAAGSAGAVAMTTISDEEPTTDSALEQVIDGESGDLAVDCDASDGSLQVFEEQIDTDTADDGDDVDPCADEDPADDGEDSADDDAEGEDEQEEADDADGEDAPVVDNAAAVACADEANPDGYANFGAKVSALRACGYEGGMSELAHEKNAERKAAKAPAEESEDEVVEDETDEDAVEEEVTEEETEDATDDTEDDADAEEEVEDDTSEVSTESTDAPGAHGKGHAKKK
jgi:hypothetical protein